MSAILKKKLCIFDLPYDNYFKAYLVQINQSKKCQEPKPSLVATFIEMYLVCCFVIDYIISTHFIHLLLERINPFRPDESK